MSSIKYKNSESGYIALIATIIITAVLSVITVSISQMSFLNRANISGTYLKEKSRALSESCVNMALLKLVKNKNYLGPETINVASSTCKVISVVASGQNKIISTQGEVRGFYTNYKVTVTASPISIVSFEEVQSF